MFWKTLLALVATLLALAAASIFGSVLGYLPTTRILIGQYSLALGLAGRSVLEKSLWSGGAFVVMLVALFLFGLVVRAGVQRSFTISNQKFGRFLSTGQVIVNARSIHALTAYTAERIKGIYEAGSRVRLVRRGWNVDLQIVVAPETSLPELLSLLKERMQSTMLNHTGLPVRRLRIWAQFDPISKKKRVY